MYATTKEFLIRFGLNDLNDLPKVEDMAEALGFEAPGGLADAGAGRIGVAVRRRKVHRSKQP